MADAAFDFLGDAGIRSVPAGDASNTHASTGAHKEEEDAFSAAVSVWRGMYIYYIHT